MGRARAWWHEVDDEGATLAFGVVGRCMVQGLAVVEEGTAGGQVDDFGLVLVDPVADVEEGTGLCGAVVVQRIEMGSGYQVHCTVCRIYIIESPAETKILSYFF